MDTLSAIFGNSGLTPHGFCLLWQPGLLSVHAAADTLIGIAYFSIPIALISFVRRRKDLAYSWIFWLFAVFILSCGTTHFMSVLTLWRPYYWLDGGIKLVTALLSVATAFLLWPLIPRALSLPSPAELSLVNLNLERQIVEREQTQRTLLETERRLRESEKLKTIGEMEEKFRLVVEATPSATIMVNAEGRIELVNAQAAAVLGYERDELLGRSVESLIPERFRPTHPMLRENFSATPRQRRMGLGQDLFALRKDGSEFPVEVGLNPIEMADGPKILAAIVDMTERKRREDKLEAALREKELLLSEVHHRVKNNLQVTSSLLSLHAARIKDPVVAEILKDSQNRVKSMALIHQTLYEENDFAHVDFQSFLQSICSGLLRSYDYDPAGMNLSVNAANVALPIISAVPCGLIVNELMTNALKHAFGGVATPQIVIELRQDGPDAILSMSDNGVGLPEHFDIGQSQSLGLQLVNLLTDQLHGHLTIQRRLPTRFELRFPLKA